MRLLRRKPKVDRARFPHDYVGPDSIWGLRNGTPCVVVGKRSGGKRIKTPDGKLWTVGSQHVQRAVKAA